MKLYAVLAILVIFLTFIATVLQLGLYYCAKANEEDAND